MQMPQPAEQHRRLARLAGTWRAEERMFPSPWDPKGGSAVGHTEARVVLDGFFVESHYRQERDGRVTYRGLGLFGYDTNAQKYTMHWFDNTGGCSPSAPALGAWDGNRLVFQHSPFPGTTARYTYDFESDTRYRFRLENSQDGGTTWAPFVETVSSRV